MFGDRVHDILHLFEDGQINRRDLVHKLTGYLGSTAAAVAAINAAGLAEAQVAQCPAGVQVPENDPAITSQMLTISGEASPVYIYQSLPADWATKRTPAVLVIHENRGLTDYIKDVTRRVAKAGYVAIAVDLLSRQGGTQAFPDANDAGTAYNRTRPEERRADSLSALFTIRDQSYVRGDRLGVLGFCAGGGVVWDLALNTTQLAAAVAYYGNPVPAVADIPRINAPMLCHYGELDRTLTASLGPVMQALATGNKRFEVHVYANANHAFHNDTSPRYDPAASCDSWAKTLDHFNRYLNRP